jgi:Tfp pilus assembly protein PilO
MKITDRELVLGIATMACVLFGGTWFAVNGKVAEWKTKKTEIVRLREQISRHEAAIRMQDDWLDELHELEKELRVFDTKQRSVSPDLMKTIDIIAEKYKLNITKTNPQAERPTDDLFEMSLNCTWQGELDAVVGFLTELQQQGVRYNIRTLNIKPLGQNTGKLQGNMVIDCAFTRRNTAAEQEEQPAETP